MLRVGQHVLGGTEFDDPAEIRSRGRIDNIAPAGAIDGIIAQIGAGSGSAPGVGWM